MSGRPIEEIIGRAEVTENDLAVWLTARGIDVTITHTPIDITAFIGPAQWISQWKVGPVRGRPHDTIFAALEAAVRTVAGE